MFKYIIEHKDENNSLIITNRQLGRVSGTSQQTAQDTINLLKEAGLITKKTGAIMLTPKIAHRGSNGKEQYLLRKFEAFDGNSNAEK